MTSWWDEFEDAWVACGHLDMTMSDAAQALKARAAGAPPVETATRLYEARRATLPVYGKIGTPLQRYR